MPNEMAFTGVFLGMICVIVAIAMTIAVFYLLTLQKALSHVAPRNRLMEPGLVWLAIIPVFNLVWSFFIGTRVPDSLRNEFRNRGQDDGTDYGKGIGLANAILGVVVFILNMGSNVLPPDARLTLSFVLLPLGIASLVLFILFWVRIAGYSAKLGQGGYSLGGGRDHGQYGTDDDYGGRDPLPPRAPSDAIRPEDPGHYR